MAEHTITVDATVYDFLRKKAVELEMVFAAESDVLKVILGLRSSSFLPFEEAKVKARDTGIGTAPQWRRFALEHGLPEGLPENPPEVYKNQGWSGWSDFLGSPKFLSFTKAHNQLHDNVIPRSSGNSQKDWLAFCKSGEKPSEIPSNPNKIYANSGWPGWTLWMTADYNPENKSHIRSDWETGR